MMIIAVDGPAASGKGTLSKRVAFHYALAYLDTGSLYRAVARDTVIAGGDPSDEAAAVRAAENIDPATLDDPGLRARGVGEAASIVAAHAQVRAALLAYQRSFAAQPAGAVIDGRDIGTVICPDATVKLFVTATPEERARRRYLQLAESGFQVTEAEVLSDIRKRDERDKGREAAPLVKADDAHLLDTTNLSIDAAFKAAIDVIDAALGRSGTAS